jgi:hypothetical protein
MPQPPTCLTRGALRALCTAVAGVLLTAALPAHAAETYLTGNLSEVTTVPEGLLIRLDNGLPDHCAGTPYNWMLVPETHKTVLAMTMMLWLAGKREMTVYTRAYTGNGYCTVWQVDPAG